MKGSVQQREDGVGRTFRLGGLSCYHLLLVGVIMVEFAADRRLLECHDSAIQA